MDIVTTARLVKDFGTTIVCVCLLVWLVVYIVKRMAESIDKSNLRMEKFMDRVRSEHEHIAQNHEKLMTEHNKMIELLTAINNRNGSASRERAEIQRVVDRIDRVHND